jgi:MFS transporter, OFA family, oxalate/formate antiporter
MANAHPTNAAVGAGISNRWVQLVIGIACMAMVANLQYGWTLFVNPIQEAMQWKKAAIQVAFTLFVLLETWLVPVEGWLVDKFGPRLVVMAGGVLVGIAWCLNSVATTLPMFYLGGIVGGAGAGAVYGTCIGNALKLFPDRRGLAAGLTAAGFGAGSALTIIPISNMIKASGYQHTFLVFGLIQGISVLVLGAFLRTPAVAAPTSQARRSYAVSEVLRTPIFWVMYAMFVMMAAGGLMVTAQLGPIARDFHVDKVPVSLVGVTLPALTFALSIDRALNGLTRPFFGWVSDMIGRELTMFIAFTLEGIGILALMKFGQNPIAFVVLSGLVFFAWGEIYCLFPATCTDVFGARYATVNAGALYTAKGTASLLVPFASVLSAGGNWDMVFWVASALNIIAAIAAIAVLKPMRERRIRDSAAKGIVLVAEPVKQ